MPGRSRPTLLRPQLHAFAHNLGKFPAHAGEARADQGPVPDDPSRRITAIIELFVPTITQAPPTASALDRVLEVALGAVTGFAVSFSLGFTNGALGQHSPRGSSTPQTRRMLLKTVQSGKIDPKKLITHRFKLDRILDAYDTFARAASTQALKVVIAA